MIWLTRDTLPNGDLIPFVCLWTIRPERFLDMPPNGAGHEESIDLDDCRDTYGGVPDTDLECIRAGTE